MAATEDQTDEPGDETVEKGYVDDNDESPLAGLPGSDRGKLWEDKGCISSSLGTRSGNRDCI
jgi:hypothetical protein